MSPKINLPKDRDLAQKVLEHEAHQKAREIGLIGKVFGSVADKPGNVAAFSIVVSFILLGLVLVWGEDTASLSKKDMVTIIAGFITLTLGFMFGRTTS